MNDSAKLLIDRIRENKSSLFNNYMDTDSRLICESLAIFGKEVTSQYYSSGGKKIKLLKIENFLKERDFFRIVNKNTAAPHDSGFGIHISNSAIIWMSETYAYYTCCDIELGKTLDKYFKIFYKPEQTLSHINVLMQSQCGLELKPCKIKSGKNILLHYPKLFWEVDKKVKSFLQSSESGMCMFSGHPGTGKTSYIRHLTRHIKKKFIFVPSHMVDSIVNPALIKVLLDNTDSILVIEDAEKALMKRANDNQSMVSSLLNIADGFMADVTRCKIVLTFNCDEHEVDEALMRPGRLRVSHKFSKLNREESNDLLISLGKRGEADGPMSLAEIFNIDQVISGNNVKKSIGFGA